MKQNPPVAASGYVAEINRSHDLTQCPLCPFSLQSLLNWQPSDQNCLRSVLVELLREYRAQDQRRLLAHPSDLIRYELSTTVANTPPIPAVHACILPAGRPEFPSVGFQVIASHGFEDIVGPCSLHQVNVRRPNGE